MKKPKKVPFRLCLGCREMKPKKELIRLVRTPQDNIEIDLTGKMAGRGAYICPQIECLELAVKGKRLEKALQRPVTEDIIFRLRQRFGDSV